MLLFTLALRCALAVALPLPLPMQAAAAAAEKSESPTTAVASTQPAATAATATAATDASDDDTTLIRTFSHTRLGQLAQGKKKVSLAEMKDPSFWIDTIKDLVIAVAGFVPRLLVSVIFLVVFWGVYRGLR